MKNLMKKIFAPLAVFALALGVGLTASKVPEGVLAAVTYTGSENFEGTTNLTSSYATNSFTGSSEITFSYANSRNEDTYPITSKGLMLRYADSYLQFTLPGGLAGLKFQYRKAFTGTSVRQLELIINDSQVALSPTFGTISGAEAAIYDFVYEPSSGHSGSVSVKIKNVGSGTTNKQTVIDNIQWADNATSDVVTALTVSPTSKSYFTTSTLQSSDFSVSITKNGLAGTSNDYTAKIGSGTGSEFVGTDIAWGTTKPLTSNSTIQFKANYPQTAGQQDFLSVDIGLSVSIPSVTNVAITGTLTKTSYFTYEYWSPAGLTVTATYEDSTTANVTSDPGLVWSYSPPAPNSTSISSVRATASFGGKTGYIDISGITVSVAMYQSATLAYPAGAGTTNMVAGNNATSVGLDDSIFNVESTERGGSPLHIGLNNAGRLNLYGSSDTSGNILTVGLLDSDYYIFSFTINYGTSVAPVIINSGGDSLFNGTPSASGTQEFTWLNDSGFSIQNVVDSTTQVYILSIEIQYVTAAQAATLFANEVNDGEGLNAKEDSSCSAVLTSLTAKYNSLPSSAKTIFDGSSDSAFVDARARMAYLNSWVTANSSSGARQIITTTTKNNLVAVISIGAVGLTSILGYYFINKKKSLG